jgi:hypothetical protein
MWLVLNNKSLTWKKLQKRGMKALVGVFYVNNEDIDHLIISPYIWVGRSWRDSLD